DNFIIYTQILPESVAILPIMTKSEFKVTSFLQGQRHKLGCARLRIRNSFTTLLYYCFRVSNIGYTVSLFAAGPLVAKQQAHAQMWGGSCPPCCGFQGWGWGMGGLGGSCGGGYHVYGFVHVHGFRVHHVGGGGY